MKNENAAIVFIIEDDIIFLEMIHDFIKLKFPFLKLHKFTNGEDALKQIRLDPQIVIIDFFLDSKNKGAQNGLDILLHFRKLDPSIRIVMLSSQEKPEIAASVIKYGAYDYVVKNETALNRVEIILTHLTGHLILDQKVIMTKLLMVLGAAGLIGLLIALAFLL
ncbi:MAG TPA: response regulator [Bacteroidia bacterium]|nr:response regulator [Bacteroidia bacterium]